MRQQLSAGTLLHGGTYRIDGVLGQGSFGITYLAEHTGLGRKVAIKEFFMRDLNSRADDGSITGMSDGSLSQNYCAKFRKEAINLSRLDHPNIVRVTDSFSENGTFYYVMDYIDGQNLNDYVKSHQVGEREATGIIMAVADALTYMHEQKHMLHLDLKPGNVMRRSSDGHIFLIDFGLSKHYSDNGQPETSTTIGLGTAGYAPIEQGNMAKNGEFRPTIDVYALGATFYKLLTGDTPPAASDLVSDDELLESNLRAKGVSSGLTQIVCAAMCPSVKKRTPTVRDFTNSIIDYSAHPNSGTEKANVQDGTKQSPSKEREDEATVVAENSNNGQTPSGPRVTRVDDYGFAYEPQGSAPQEPQQESVLEKKHSIFSFRGRVDEVPWLIGVLALLPIMIFSSFEKFDASGMTLTESDLYTDTMLVYIALILYILVCLSVKRCHDCNYSGFALLWPPVWDELRYGGGCDYVNKYGPKDNGVSKESAYLLLAITVALSLFWVYITYIRPDLGVVYAPADSAAGPLDSVEDTTGYY